jgi:hypothetical protein
MSKASQQDDQSEPVIVGEVHSKRTPGNVKVKQEEEKTPIL